MLAIRALSIAFWSAARLLLICFFCGQCVSLQSQLGSLSKRGMYRRGKSVTYLGLLSLLEESLLTGLVLGLLSGEVLGLRNLLDLLGVQTSDIDLVRGGDDVSRVNAAQGNTVDLEGASDEEDTLVEGLDENDALAAEAASEEDQDGTGLERLAGSPRADGLANLRSWNVSATVAACVGGNTAGMFP